MIDFRIKKFNLILFFFTGYFIIFFYSKPSYSSYFAFLSLFYFIPILCPATTAGLTHLNRQAQLPSSRAGQPDTHRGKRDSRGICGLAEAWALEGARSLDCAWDDYCWRKRLFNSHSTNDIYDLAADSSASFSCLFIWHLSLVEGVTLIALRTYTDH